MSADNVSDPFTFVAARGLSSPLSHILYFKLIQDVYAKAISSIHTDQEPAAALHMGETRENGKKKQETTKIYPNLQSLEEKKTAMRKYRNKNYLRVILSNDF